MKWLLLALLACVSCVKPIHIEEPIVSLGTKEQVFDILRGKFEEVKFKDGYLHRKRVDRQGNCMITRTPIEWHGGVAFMRPFGNTESCVGDGCSHCAFAKGGGCECKKISGRCNHIVIRNHDLLQWRAR